MDKIMYYAVDKDNHKYLYSIRPTKSEDEGIWIIVTRLYKGFEDDITVMNVTNTYETMGLPDITWEDEPLEVKLICVNKNKN